MVGPVVIRTVVPSAAAFITDLIPIRPSAPVRFSTMMVRSSAPPQVLGDEAAQHVAAAAGRERKDQLGQRPGLGERPAGARKGERTGASVR